jgi:hypothetical protein
LPRPRLIDCAVVCAYLAIAAFPLLTMGRHVKRLDGVTMAAPVPPLTLDAVTSERYQHGVTAWFERNLGYKSPTVHIDNSILFHVFGETKPGASVKIGNDGVLFVEDDLYYAAKYAEGLLPTAAQIDAFAARLAALQARLGADHRALVPVIIPSKVAVHPGAVPDAYHRDVGTPRPVDVLVYAELRRALDRHAVAYVDARALLTAPDLDPLLVWGRQARHWTHYAACLTMHEVAAVYRARTGRPLGDYPCVLGPPRPFDPFHPDYDLYRLLNVWGLAWAPEPPPDVEMPEPAPTAAEQPSVMIAGTSFVWQLVRDATRAGVFHAIYADYYHKTIFIWPTSPRVVTRWLLPANGIPLERGGAAWTDAAADRDLYVLDLFEGYLLLGSYATEFLDDLERTLDYSTSMRTMSPLPAPR